MLKYLVILFFIPCNLLGQEQSKVVDSTVALSVSQETEKRHRNAIYLDQEAKFTKWENSISLWSFVASINYEWEFFKTKDELLSLRLRSGIASIDLTTIGPPLAVSTLVGKGNNHLDVSLGAFLGIWEPGYGSTFVALPIVEVGYRFQRPTGGLIWQINANYLGIGAGVGWAF